MGKQNNKLLRKQGRLYFCRLIEEVEIITN